MGILTSVAVAAESTGIQLAVESMLGYAGDVLDAIIAEPNLCLFLGASVVGIAISIVRKVIRTR